MTTFGSVCSGIEAASVAWHPLGWRAAWLSEVEPFPCAVLAHHYRTVPNLGDMTALPEMIRAGLAAAPDVFTGGTPCQAFSVAGKRESLGDARGNLSLTFCEIANAIDDVRHADGREPCVVVWENVPGVLSTADNAFGCFLGALAGADCELQPAGGRWTNAGVVLGPRRTVAWRVIDAQYFGLAQRRRRVFVVASARNGFDPAAVLFEFDGVRRDSPPSREAREGTAGGAGHGAAFGGGNRGGAVEVAACLVAKGQKCDFEVETFVTAHTLRGEGFDASEDGTGRGTPLVPVSVAMRGRDGGAACEVGDDCAFTLRASSGGGDKPHVLAPVAFDTYNQTVTGDVTQTLCSRGDSPGGNAHLVPAIAIPFDTTQITSAANYSSPKPGDTCHPLAAGAHAPAIAFPWQLGGTMGMSHDVDLCGTLVKNQTQAVAFAENSRAEVRLEGGDGSVVGTLSTGGGKAGQGTPTVAAGMAVRRLTPTECERLQGFPDGYTLIPWRKKPAYQCPDGPRYKALGNSWAVPCAAWIGQRIEQQLRSNQ